MHQIDRFYEKLTTKINRSNRYIRAFADCFSAAVCSLTAKIKDSSTGFRRKYVFVTGDPGTEMSAAAAFKMDPAAQGLRPYTPDPDFPEFLKNRDRDYPNMEIDELENLWREYCLEADTSEFDSFYEKREAYRNARPEPLEGRYNFGGPRDKVRYAGETFSAIAGYVSGAVFSGVLMATPMVSVTILDSINDRLKSREDYSASKA